MSALPSEWRLIRDKRCSLVYTNISRRAYGTKVIVRGTFYDYIIVYDSLILITTAYPSDPRRASTGAQFPRRIKLSLVAKCSVITGASPSAHTQHMLSLPQPFPVSLPFETFFKHQISAQLIFSPKAFAFRMENPLFSSQLPFSYLSRRSSRALNCKC